MRRYVIIVLFLLIPLVSADLTLTISPPSSSFNLYHSQSNVFFLSVNNDQSWCDLSCSSTFEDVTNGRIIWSGGSWNMKPQVSMPQELEVIAPKKEPGKPSGILYYTYKVECNEKVNLLKGCIGDDSATETATITLNYDLSPDDKRMRDEAKVKLDKLKGEMMSLEREYVNINIKIKQQPSNLEIDNIKDKINSYYSSYSNTKKYYDDANKKQGDLYFKEALDSLNNIDSNWGNAYIQNYKNLNSDLDQRIILHNQQVDLLNELSKIISDINNLNRVLNNPQAKQYDTDYNNLKNKFESGTFTSYYNLAQETNSLKTKAITFTSDLNSETNKVIDQGLTLIRSDTQKNSNLLSGYAISNPKYSLEGLQEVCNQLNSAQRSLREDNSNKQKEYNNAINYALEYNSKVTKINAKILEANILSQNLNKLSGSSNIKDTDYTKCQSILLDLKKELKSQELGYNSGGLDLSKCIELKDYLNENKEEGILAKIKLFFLSFFNRNKIEFVDVEPLNPMVEPTSPKLNEINQESVNYLSSNCDIQIDTTQEIITSRANPENFNTTFKSGVSDIVVKENVCCIFGKCEPCCKGDTCNENEDYYPVIFLHGHAFSDQKSPDYSLDTFNGMQNALIDEGFVNGGMILPNLDNTKFQRGEWSKVNAPFTVKTTYYYNAYSDQGTLTNTPSKHESIDTYSKRLADDIEKVKQRTGRKKVNIVAHSMGGLVARNYIKNYGGESSVNKLIMIGTPNHGVYGQVADNCDKAVGIFNTGAPIECAEMINGSPFLNNLNSGDETFGNVEYYTIAGSGCFSPSIDGDGVVRVASVQLNGAENVVINKAHNECWNTLNRDLHFNLLDNNKYPKATEYVIQFLK